jgi:phosphatidylglycerol:prolipoprotein diacylglycerol transferase
VPWAIRFPRGSLAWSAQVARGELSSVASWSLPVHPEQIYLLLNAAMLFVVISHVWRKNRQRPGLTLAIYLVLYGATRFCWEFLRDPAAGGAAHGLSSSQWMCVVYVAAGSVLLRLRGRATAGY